MSTLELAEIMASFPLRLPGAFRRSGLWASRRKRRTTPSFSPPSAGVGCSCALGPRTGPYGKEELPRAVRLSSRRDSKLCSRPGGLLSLPIDLKVLFWVARAPFRREGEAYPVESGVGICRVGAIPHVSRLTGGTQSGSASQP